MNRRTFFAVLLASAALTALVHGRALLHDFVYDDLWTIVRNPAIQTAGPARFFTDASTAAAPETGMGRTIYRPLPTWTFALNRKAAGLRPWAWRLPNLLLHALNGALVFFLLSGALGLGPAAAALGAALFLVHPAQVESVAWITQRSNLMCAAGGLGALLLLARGNPWGLAAYGAALLSKETAATLLPFILWTVWARPDDRRKKIVLSAAAAVLTAAYAVLRTAVVGGVAQREWRGGFLDNLLVGQASWLEYVSLLLRPVRLTVSHMQYVDNPWEHPAPWLGALLLLLWVGAVPVLWRRGFRLAALAMAWIPATLSLHLGFLPLDTFVAERFLYLPVAGLAVLLALAWDASSRRGIRALLATLVLFLAVAAFRRNGDWRDDLALWRAAVRTEPHNPFARLSLAEAYFARERFPEAAQATRDALTLRPSVSLAFAGLNNLSNLALMEGRPGAALRFADRALRIDSDSVHARRNRERALALLQKKSPAEKSRASH